MRRGLWIAAFLALATIGACRWLVPEEYAVNAPLGYLLFGRTAGAPSAAVFRERVRVPEGFAIGFYAEGLGNARMLRFTPAGDLLVSTPRSGRVVLLRRDTDGDGRADGVETLLADLDRPHGMDLRDGWLYVAESGAVGRVRFDAGSGALEGPFERVLTGLPAGGNHWTRTLGFGPDGWMYVSIGSSCNACIEEHPWRASIVRARPDGSDAEIFASGLRNAVGFDWRPADGALYATDNGRDLLGDDFPPCELDRVVRGGFYGWPFANGFRVPDPDLGAGHAEAIAGSIPPVHGFRAHTAPLGITFWRGDGFPEPWRGAAFVALHGSWNRTRKIGYEVVSLHFAPDGSVEERPFVTGFLEDGDVIGRPVDVAEGPDGALYVSDDYAGAVYRVSHGDAVASPAAPGGAAPTPAAAQEHTADPQALARGRALFAEHDCATCHDTDAAPEGVVVHPLEDLDARFDAESLAAFLAAPTPPMPVAPLTPDERRDLAAWLLAQRAEGERRSP